MSPCNIPDDDTLVDLPITLDRGLLGMGKYEVPEGKAAVITVGGRYHCTWEAGTHYLNQLPARLTIQSRLVDTRRRRFTLRTSGTETILEPQEDGSLAVFRVQVGMTVEYRVEPAQARVVSLEVERPLESICTQATSLVSELLMDCSYNDYRRGAKTLGTLIKNRLENARVGANAGITVLDVTVTDLLPPAAMPNISGRLPDNVIMTQYPAVYEAVVRQIERLIREIRDRGDQVPNLYGKTLMDQHRLLLAALASPHTMPIPSQGPVLPPLEPALPPPSADLAPPMPINALDAIWDALAPFGEVRHANGYSGARGLPDGTHIFTVVCDAGGAAGLTVTLRLPPSYPAAPPERTVQKTGVEPQSLPVSLEKWAAGRDIAALVAEAIRYYA